MLRLPAVDKLISASFRSRKATSPIALRGAHRTLTSCLHRHSRRLPLDRRMARWSSIDAVGRGGGGAETVIVVVTVPDSPMFE